MRAELLADRIADLASDDLHRLGGREGRSGRPRTMRPIASGKQRLETVERGA